MTRLHLFVSSLFRRKKYRISKTSRHHLPMHAEYPMKSRLIACSRLLASHLPLQMYMYAKLVSLAYVKNDSYNKKDPSDRRLPKETCPDKTAANSGDLVGRNDSPFLFQKMLKHYSSRVNMLPYKTSVLG